MNGGTRMLIYASPQLGSMKSVVTGKDLELGSLECGYLHTLSRASTFMYDPTSNSRRYFDVVGSRRNNIQSSQKAKGSIVVPVCVMTKILIGVTVGMKKPSC